MVLCYNKRVYQVRERFFALENKGQRLALNSDLSEFSSKELELLATFLTEFNKLAAEGVKLPVIRGLEELNRYIQKFKKGHSNLPDHFMAIIQEKERWIAEYLAIAKGQ